MAGFNRLIIVGNLTRDPEYRQLPSGQAVCRLAVATNRQFKNKQTSAMVQEVCYVDVDVWGAQAESCQRYLKKGSQILVEGRLKFDSWEDQTGQKRSKHSVVADRVVFLDSGTGAEVGEQESADEQRADMLAQSNKEVANQLNNLKVKLAAKSAATALPTGEIAIQDEPPFKEELPF